MPPSCRGIPIQRLDQIPRTPGIRFSHLKGQLARDFFEFHAAHTSPKLPKAGRRESDQQPGRDARRRHVTRLRHIRQDRFPPLSEASAFAKRNPWSRHCRLPGERKRPTSSVSSARHGEYCLVGGVLCVNHSDRLPFVRCVCRPCRWWAAVCDRTLCTIWMKR